ncbi:MAG: phosphatidate cytidylyltransferase [Thermoguttaceae bacterium]|jgi:phosphatidate cytidylyltransferase
MLRWRLGIGLPLVALLVYLFWLDHILPVPGLVLMPLFLIAIFFLCREVLDLLNAGNIFPRRSTVYIGTYWILICSWLAGYQTLPQIKTNEGGWEVAATTCLLTLLVMAGGILIAFVGEMARFKKPGGNTINLSGAIFIIAYIGMMSSFMIMLRCAYGIGAIFSMVVTTKFCDTGAFTIGKLFGKHKLSSIISPHKTIEGGIGGLLAAIGGAWLTIGFLIPLALHTKPTTPWWGIVLYGICVGIAGGIGDLAESLIKRDVQKKDSGEGVPGFGGILDLFDSLLLAAPVAFSLWAFELVQ